MKAKIIIVMSLAMANGAAVAVTCSRVGCPDIPSNIPAPSGCAQAEWVCATNGTLVSSPHHSCQTCNEGYERVESSYAYEGLGCTDFQMQISMHAYICEKKNECGSDCITGAWQSPLGGYQVRTVKECVNGSCKSSAEFRCNTGYYGTPKSVGSGCTRCPSSGGVYGLTAGPGATAITSCFLPTGTAFSDDAGSGEYTAPCYWKI